MLLAGAAEMGAMGVAEAVPLMGPTGRDTMLEATGATGELATGAGVLV